MFDSDNAATVTNRMWLRLGRSLDKVASKEAEAGHTSTAIRAARCAEACYWQATGEGTAVDLKDVIS